MQLDNGVSVEVVSRLIECSNVIKGTGAPSLILGINELHSVSEGDIMFVDHPKYYQKALDSLASFIITNKEIECPSNKVLFVCEDPFKAYQQLVNHFAPYNPPTHQHISSKAIIGSGTMIAPTAFVGDDVMIGKDCIIHPHVIIENRVVIGDRVVINAGASIGQDAFYYNKRAGEKPLYERMPSCGSVCIEDDVEIGANSTVDRGVSGETFIGSGTKIDNLVQIAHEVHIKEDCIIASQVGIAGHVILGNRVTIWGKCGIVASVSIADDVTLLGATMVASSIDTVGSVYLGQPAIDASTKRREFVYMRRLPEMWRQLQKILPK